MSERQQSVTLHILKFFDASLPAIPSAASDLARLDGPSPPLGAAGGGRKSGVHCTVTLMGDDAMPFVTTTRSAGPVSMADGTSYCVDTPAEDATAIEL